MLSLPAVRPLTVSTLTALTLSAPGAASAQSATFAAEFYDNLSFSGAPALTRDDPTIDFDWAQDAPGPGVPPSGFTARWTGTIVAPTTARYTLATTSDDGVRLWIDGALVIDHWTDHSATRDTADLDLVAGQSYAVRMEYFDSGWEAVARLTWSSPTRPEAPVPASSGGPIARPPIR